MLLYLREVNYIKGLVIKSIAGIYDILNLETKEVLKLKPRGKFRYTKLDESSSFLKQETRRTKLEKKTIKLTPKVGDYVIYNDNYILEILERKNELIRPDVSNVDNILLIFSCIDPDFSFNLLDKFIVLITKANIDIIIVVTKVDLLSDEELKILKNKLSYYNKYYKIFYVSNKNNIGLTELKKELTDKIIVLSGQTGSGKSSLLNNINPYLELKTNEISYKLGRGKHTTRHTELFIFNGFYIADTPGFSSLEFNNFKEEELKDYYIDFEEYKSDCKFKGCNHISEPGCKIKELYENGVILKDRYENYLKFFNEIKNQKVKY